MVGGGAWVEMIKVVEGIVSGVNRRRVSVGRSVRRRVIRATDYLRVGIVLTQVHKRGSALSPRQGSQLDVGQVL